MAEILLHADGLGVGYAESVVCAPVRLTLRAGDLVAIIGPNGSGKSTLLRTLLGQLAPIKGTVKAFGEPVDERRRVFRAAVAGVLDEDSYFPALTVREHLVLTARGHGVAGAGAIADELLDRFGLGGHAGSLPNALSSGQRRRLLLAAGFARPHRLLVCDEPEQRLDPQMRADLAQMLAAEAANGVGVVIATHDAELLRATGARGLVVGDDECRPLGPSEAFAALSEIRGS